MALSSLKIGFVAVCDDKTFSILETGTRISFFQSHVRDGNENFSLSISCSRREREFLFLNLVFRDKNNNFFQSHALNKNFFLSGPCFETRMGIFHSIPGFETRTRIEIETILARIFENYIYRSFID